jgi:hypothetical protein
MRRSKALDRVVRIEALVLSDIESALHRLRVGLRV